MSHLVPLMLYCLASQANPPPQIDIDDPPDGLFLELYWLVEVKGQPAGWEALRFQRRDSRIVSHTESHLEFRRFGTSVILSESCFWMEMLDGQPLMFESASTMGKSEIKRYGAVKDGTLTTATAQGGPTSPQKYPFPAGALMPWGKYRVQRLHGFAPGNEFSIREYDPEKSIDNFIERMYTVVGPEKVTLRDQEHDATLVIESSKGTHGKIRRRLWCDDAGFVLVEESSLGGLGTTRKVRTDPEVLEKIDFDPPELFASAFVPVGRALEPHRMVSARYRLRFRDPNDQFIDVPQTSMQTAEPITGNPVTITVRRFERGAAHQAKEAAPAEDMAPYLASNDTFDLKDPVLQAMAKGAIGDETDPWTQAHKLRERVSRHIGGMNLEVAFATASQAARDRKGDCTEHATLLAALGRVIMIPSRLALGMVFVDEFGDQKHFFAPHMWTQFHVDGQWIDFDSALGESECDPTHIALRTLALESGSANEAGAVMLVYQGQVELEVLDVEMLDTK